MEWHAKNQQAVVAALNRSGFSAEYRSDRALRVEWGHSLMQQPHTAASLRPHNNEGVEEAARSALCRKVARPPRASKYYDPSLTVLTPEAVLERARLAAESAPVAQQSDGAAAVQRAVAKLTQGETGLKLSRLSTAAREVETESSLTVLENEIEAQRTVDDSRHSIDSLFGEINSAAKSKGDDPLAALEAELAKGPTDRRVREVEALIEEVDMAATPNTRRKNQERRKQTLMAKATAGAAAANRSGTEAEPAANRPELTTEVLQRTSRARQQADETFEKEARRLAKTEADRPSDEARVEAERAALVKAAEEAERLADESSRSVASNSNASFADEASHNHQPHHQAVDERAARAQAEARDRELREAALAEERRNLAELKASQMEALAKQRAAEEREAAELRAELELTERAQVALQEERFHKEREAAAAQMREQEAKLMAEQERDQIAKVEAARKAQQAEQQRQREALEQLQRQAAVVAPVVSVPDDVAFTPIAANKGGAASALDTPMSLQIKDDLNIEAMLGQLDLDLGAPSEPALANKRLAVAAGNTTMTRDSTARELEGLDAMMAGMDAFSFDTSVAATPVRLAAASLGGSRTGGLNIREPVKTEELDVEAALGAMDFERVAQTGASSSPHQPLQHNFSTVHAHDTAKEVVQATHQQAPHPTAAVSQTPARNAFDDFTLDTLDTTGTSLSAASLNFKVDLDAIGASPAKAAEEVKAADARVAAETHAADVAKQQHQQKQQATSTEHKAEVIQDDKSKAGFGDKKALFEAAQTESAKPALSPRGAAPEKVVTSPAAAATTEKKAEIIQDDKSKAGFGDKKAMFDAPKAAPAAASGRKNKNKNKKGKKK